MSVRGVEDDEGSNLNSYVPTSRRKLNDFCSVNECTDKYDKYNKYKEWILFIREGDEEKGWRMKKDSKSHVVVRGVVWKDPG